jgi:hypothetical protein
MTTSLSLPCDGCGQNASPEHIARRLQRLEWTTRYRPVHIQALLLGAIAPEADAAFLYCPEGNYEGEAASVLDALQIDRAGRVADAVLSEFQKRGLLLTYVLGCRLEPEVAPSAVQKLLEAQLPSAIARIRRSLKPKRVVLYSKELAPMAAKLSDAALGCPVITGPYGPWRIDSGANEDEREGFQEAVDGGS